MNKSSEIDQHLNFREDFLKLENIRRNGIFYPSGPNRVEEVTGQKFNGNWSDTYAIIVKNNFGNINTLEKHLESPHSQHFPISLATFQQIDKRKIPVFLIGSPITKEFLQRLNTTENPDIVDVIFFNYAFESLTASLNDEKNSDFEAAFATDHPLTVLKNIALSIGSHDDELAKKLLHLVGVYRTKHPTLRPEMLETVRRFGRHKFFRKLGQG